MSRISLAICSLLRNNKSTRIRSLEGNFPAHCYVIISSRSISAWTILAKRSSTSALRGEQLHRKISLTSLPSTMLEKLGLYKGRYAQDFAPNNKLLDFGCALIKTQSHSITVVALHGIIVGIAVATMYLDSFLR